MNEYEGEVVCKVKDANQNEANNKKGGRPRISESKKRKISIAVSFTEKEYDEIKRLSDLLGCRPAVLLRNMYFAICEKGEFVARVDKTTNEKLRYEVLRVMNLLEQIIVILRGHGLVIAANKEVGLIKEIVKTINVACEIGEYLEQSK
jgi:ribulose-5-phosphate 4-epimerase/fuculose-1-phosphate aldolase